MRTRAIIVAGAACVALYGCDGPVSTNYTVEVRQKSFIGRTITATVEDGVTGSCSLRTATGQATVDLAGVGDFDRTFEGAAISCAASAENQYNGLTVTIRRPDGSVVASGSTSQRFGTVAVSGR